jgi:hypothetical protein
MKTGGKQGLPLTFNGLHGVISQKIKLFISITVRTSNPTTKNLSVQNYRVTNPKPLGENSIFLPQDLIVGWTAFLFP